MYIYNTKSTLLIKALTNLYVCTHTYLYFNNIYTYPHTHPHVYISIAYQFLHSWEAGLQSLKGLSKITGWITIPWIGSEWAIYLTERVKCEDSHSEDYMCMT